MPEILTMIQIQRLTPTPAVLTIVSERRQKLLCNLKLNYWCKFGTCAKCSRLCSQCSTSPCLTSSPWSTTSASQHGYAIETFLAPFYTTLRPSSILWRTFRIGSWASGWPSSACRGSAGSSPSWLAPSRSTCSSPSLTSSAPSSSPWSQCSPVPTRRVSMHSHSRRQGRCIRVRFALRRGPPVLRQLPPRGACSACRVRGRPPARACVEIVAYLALVAFKALNSLGL